jgi:hypothetical protein
MAATHIMSLTDQIKQEASSEPSTSGHGHVRLLQLIDELKLAIETPTETVLRLIYQVSFFLSFLSYIATSIWSILTKMRAKPPENAALRTVVDLGIFPILVKDGRKDGLSAADLAVCTGADNRLIGMLSFDPKMVPF